jgi:hypothetical protein
MNHNSGSVSYFRLDSMAMLISVWVQIGIEGDGLEQSGPRSYGRQRSCYSFTHPECAIALLLPLPERFKTTAIPKAKFSLSLSLSLSLCVCLCSQPLILNKWTQCILWIQASKIRSIFGIWKRLQKSNHRSYWEISSLKNIKGHIESHGSSCIIFRESLQS